MAKQVFLSEKGPKPVGPYSSAVTVGNLVFVSGTGPLDPETGVRVSGGIQAEVKRTIDNIEIMLGEMGLSLSDVVKTNVYLADMDDFGAMNAIYRDRFGPAFPARTTVQAARLPGDILVEIEVIAQTRA